MPSVGIEEKDWDFITFPFNSPFIYAFIHPPTHSFNKYAKSIFSVLDYTGHREHTDETVPLVLIIC